MATAINYIEFCVGDIARSKAFYAEAFGWTYTDFGEEYCEFTDGVMKGGFTTGGPVKNEGGALVILYTETLETMQEKLEKMGASITEPIFSFPGGRRFQFKDPDGYELAIWSDK